MKNDRCIITILADEVIKSQNEVIDRQTKRIKLLEKLGLLAGSIVILQYMAFKEMSHENEELKTQLEN